MRADAEQQAELFIDGTREVIELPPAPRGQVFIPSGDGVLCVLGECPRVLPIRSDEVEASHLVLARIRKGET